MATEIHPKSVANRDAVATMPLELLGGESEVCYSVAHGRVQLKRSDGDKVKIVIILTPSRRAAPRKTAREWVEKIREIDDDRQHESRKKSDSDAQTARNDQLCRRLVMTIVDLSPNDDQVSSDYKTDMGASVSIQRLDDGTLKAEIDYPWQGRPSA